jgi:hypothetical protein
MYVYITIRNVWALEGASNQGIYIYIETIRNVWALEGFKKQGIYILINVCLCTYLMLIYVYLRFK